MIRKAVAFAVVALGVLGCAQAAARVPAPRAVREAMLYRTQAGLLHCIATYIASPGSRWGLITTTKSDVHNGCAKKLQLGGFTIVLLEDGHWTVVSSGDEVVCPFQSEPGQPLIPSGILKSLTGTYCNQLPTVATGYTYRGKYKPRAVGITGDGSAYFAGKTGKGIESGRA